MERHKEVSEVFLKNMIKVVLKEELIKNDKSCLKRRVLILHGNTNEGVSERKMNKSFVCEREPERDTPFHMHTD